MTPEDEAVRQALIEAGHGSRPAADRSELHATLRELYHESQENEDLVDRLRALLDIADKRDYDAESKQAFMAERSIKGCPGCDREPSFSQNRIRCEACPDAPSTNGLTVIDSLLSWNDDADWLRLGAPADRLGNRSEHPLPEAVLSVRKQLASEGY